MSREDRKQGLHECIEACRAEGARGATPGSEWVDLVRACIVDGDANLFERALAAGAAGDREFLLSPFHDGAAESRSREQAGAPESWRRCSLLSLAVVQPWSILKPVLKATLVAISTAGQGSSIEPEKELQLVWRVRSRALTTAPTLAEAVLMGTATSDPVTGSPSLAAIQDMLTSITEWRRLYRLPLVEHADANEGIAIRNVERYYPHLRSVLELIFTADVLSAARSAPESATKYAAIVKKYRALAGVKDPARAASAVEAQAAGEPLAAAAESVAVRL